MVLESGLVEQTIPHSSRTSLAIEDVAHDRMRPPQVRLENQSKPWMPV